MNTSSPISVCGSITKKESLIPIHSHILENTWVSEANFPYANYYGHRPAKPKPNSLFLFTENFYSLEEVLWLTSEIDKFFNQKINVASAIIEFQNRQFPAIRIKHFPDYEQLHVLQKNFINQGVSFSKKTPLVIIANAVINKCFKINEIEEGIYVDIEDSHKGYITFDFKIKRNNFDNLLSKIKNNSDCSYFDAVPGGFIINSRSIDFVRIYSEKLDKELMLCIKKEVYRYN